jgi:predicted DsbA family dithiol-disulfide isomerase
MPLHVEVFIDLICPWCFIGKRRLDRALAGLEGELPLRLTWRPFELNPSMPREGMERRAYRIAKFGSWETAEALDARVRSVGELEGIAFDFSRVQRTPNTLDAHRLVWWAQDHGPAEPLIERLFQAYFLESEDLGDPTVLLRAGSDACLDAAEVRRLLESEDGTLAVRREAERGVRLGVCGVPAFVLNGEFGLPGAQDAAVLQHAFRKAAQRG